MIILEEWLKETRDVRTQHLDLSEACLERGGYSTIHRGVLAQYLDTTIDGKADLCHACNNAKCSNPKHLYWGTRRDNTMDAIENGTHNNIWDSKNRPRFTVDHSAKGGKGNKGKPKSEEHKRKISEALRSCSSR